VVYRTKIFVGSYVAPARKELEVICVCSLYFLYTHFVLSAGERGEDTDQKILQTLADSKEARGDAAKARFKKEKVAEKENVPAKANQSRATPEPKITVCCDVRTNIGKGGKIDARFGSFMLPQSIATTMEGLLIYSIWSRLSCIF
jgi:hypothetical protein